MSVNLDLTRTTAAGASVLHVTNHVVVNLFHHLVAFVRNHMVATDAAPVWITLFHSLSPSTFTHTPCAITELGGKFVFM